MSASVQAVPDRATPRQRGVLGEKVRQVLEALYWEPICLNRVVEVTGLPRERVWPLVKHARERGLVERKGRGLYQTSADGCTMLNPVYRAAEAPVAPDRLVKPPTGWKWTKQRCEWLRTFYPLLGPHRCAVLLVRDYATVHAKASRMGLRWGQDIEGYMLLSEVARLLDKNYSNLWVRAKRAGALTFPKSVVDDKHRRKALVPDWWVEQLAAESQPPEPGWVLVETLCAELGLSKTHAQRLTAGKAVLRVPPAGGQARAYVSAEDADLIRTQRKALPKRRPALGRPAVYAAFARAGAEGLTEREVCEYLHSGVGMTRVHTRALYLEGALERCRMGSSKDPFVYRLSQWQGHPHPRRREPRPAERSRKAA